MSELVYKVKVPTTAKKQVYQKHQLRDMTWFEWVKVVFFDQNLICLSSLNPSEGRQGKDGISAVPQTQECDDSYIIMSCDTTKCMY